MVLVESDTIIVFGVQTKLQYLHVWDKESVADLHGVSDVQVHFGCRGRFSIPNCRDKSIICESMNEDYVECFACKKSQGHSG